MKNKYNIGQAVANGRIFRIEHPIYFLSQIADERKVSVDSLYSSFANWSKIDKLWFEKPLYAIKFRQPVAILSKDEFLQTYPYISKEPELIERAYADMVEKRYSLMLPEAAVIPVDEEPKEIQKILEFNDD